MFLQNSCFSLLPQPIWTKLPQSVTLSACNLYYSLPENGLHNIIVKEMTRNRQLWGCFLRFPRFYLLSAWAVYPTTYGLHQDIAKCSSVEFLSLQQDVNRLPLCPKLIGVFRQMDGNQCGVGLILSLFASLEIPRMKCCPYIENWWILSRMTDIAGFEVILSRFINSGEKTVAANMRSVFERFRAGTNCQRRLWMLHPWRRLSCDWMHGGSPSSQKSPPNPSPDTPSLTCSTLSYRTLMLLLWFTLIVYKSFQCSLSQ